MSVILALPDLYDAVVARMDADALAEEPPATPVPQPFGWRSPAQQAGSPRIVWVPGDDSSGSLGDVQAAKYPGRLPRRPLMTIAELFTVYIVTRDGSAPEDERAQYQAARELLDAWLRAVYLHARGTFEILDISWLIGRKERRFGAAIRVLGSIQAMVPDAPLETAPVDVHAEIDVEELDVNETMETPPAS